MSVRFRNMGMDLSASIVVYLVALPLCLGVAIASDALPVSGIIAGIVGGVVTGLLSRSPLSVSGPAAGLTAIVSGAIGSLQSYEVFLLSVVFAGVFQILIGYLKAGRIADFVPNAVIKGMLAAIGLILILKQIPHFLGYDKDPEGDESFLQPDQKNTYTELIDAFRHPEAGALLIGIVSLLILLLFEHNWFKNKMVFRFIPGPLVAVVFGIFINQLYSYYHSGWLLQGDHLVALPVFRSPQLLWEALPFPDVTAWTNINMWKAALTLGIVASLESLLSIEAVDKIDPEKRLTPVNQELKAQGFGNIVSGLLGGLPITSVIVRSSANVNAGARSKASTIFHGLFLIVSLLFFPSVLNLIPLSCLAAVLLMTGYKLAKPKLFLEMRQKGWTQFLPFLITIIAILQTDLLKGIIIGIVLGLLFVVRSNFKSAIFVMKDEYRYLVRFGKQVSFLNKGVVKKNLEELPDNTAVLIDATRSEFIDQDIIDIVNDFIVHAESRGIRVYIKRTAGETKEFFNDVTMKTMV